MKQEDLENLVFHLTKELTNTNNVLSRLIAYLDSELGRHNTVALLDELHKNANKKTR